VTDIMTPAVDVNEAFATERTQQIAATREAAEYARGAGQRRADDFAQRVADGKMRDLGDGRYVVTDPSSWDNGEVWTLRQDTATGVEVILPQHGLDTTAGQVALYSRVPAWHELGNVVPDGVTDIDRVLDLGGIAYDVVRRPVLYHPFAMDDSPRTAADQFVTVRQDTGAALGVVGKKYEVWQNREQFAFLEDLVQQYGIRWESAGALRDGRKVFVCMRLPETVTIDAEGINDEIIPFIVSINTHDGSGLAEVVVTPWRPVCGNTERFARRDAISRWGIRHTRNMRDRVDEARRTLGLSVKYFETFAHEENLLAQATVEIDEFRKVVRDVFEPPAEDATPRQLNTYQRKEEKLIRLWEANAERLGRTGYAAERAITEFCDWGTRVRPSGSLKGRDVAARATAMLEGSYDDEKSKAHRRLMTMVRS
jgi:phage/plasmid-like protein (TIGR03299 family)